ncbi:AraC family transcriptional regulator [Spirosoma endophyticum]|uniref:Transcriptional regulator, AraC family n=1 Tax=Spirosoma endophyticum TaxID=662367 RepID=A0A1I1PKQ4_9BACT|nr:AraC family transcriptional regulator [Spirosoma endophyticum]SFD10405.1 transcriptional regulator, AraC family [Spirosoma endophyticum]
MQDYQRLLVLNLLAYATQKNLSAAQLCTLSGIEFSTLKKGENLTLTDKQLDDLWLNATHLSHDPLFGLHFGETLQVAALGVVGELIRHSRTIGEALTHAVAFAHLITDIFVMDVTRADKSFFIRFTPDTSRQKVAPLLFSQMMDFFMAFTLHEVDGLVLEKIQPIRISMPPISADLPEYERVLRCHSIQEADYYELSFDESFWDEPILMANYELQGVLLQKVSAMDSAFGDRRKISERIGSLLLVNSYLGIPTLEAIAANLNTSSRSLQRKLQEEGITYQQLSDSTRKSLALHYLGSGQYPVKEVSYILGYNELSAFNRAFRRWTGTTPVSYQKGIING